MSAKANSIYSAAIGWNVTAEGRGQTVIGMYNKPDTSSIFIIGNGASTAQSNALTVDTSGNVVASGSIQATNAKFHDITATNAKFSYNITATSAKFSNDITATSAEFSDSIYVKNSIRLQSPNGSYFELSVNDDGTLITTYKEMEE